jgi:hypothetical protein
VLLKKINIFFSLLHINIFFVFSSYFDTLMSKIILKKQKKYYFNVFPSKKHFKKELQPHFLTPLSYILGLSVFGIVVAVVVVV